MTPSDGVRPPEKESGPAPLSADPKARSSKTATALSLGNASLASAQARIERPGRRPKGGKARRVLRIILREPGLVEAIIDDCDANGALSVDEEGKPGQNGEPAGYFDRLRYEQLTDLTHDPNDDIPPIAQADLAREFPVRVPAADEPLFRTGRYDRGEDTCPL